MITSTGAVDVYDLEQDTVPKFSLMASGYDVAVASTEAQMDELLADLSLGTGSPTLYSLGYWLSQIQNAVGRTANAFANNGIFFEGGYYLDSDGDRFYGMSNLSITEILQLGLLGLSENLKSLSSSFDLSSLVSAVNTNTTAVNAVTSAVNAVTTAVNNNKSAVDLVRSAVNDTTSAVDSLLVSTESGFRGVASLLSSVYSTLYKFSSANDILYLNYEGGLSTTSASDVFLLLDHSFLGLRSLLAGSALDNVYSGSLIDNQNLSSNFSATGLGPMLQRYLEEIQHDSGLLTYIFASPEDLEMKENSSSSMSAINDSFIDPDSDTSVSVSDIGTLSSAAGSIESFGSTGVTPDQAFAQLGNDSIFEFFTQTTADNLDSRSASYSLRDPAPQIVTNYYSESRAEFFNLIGEGSE